MERFGARQDWIRGALIAMAASLAACRRAAREPDRHCRSWQRSRSICIASATQDIAIDGYTIGLVDRGREGPANAVRTTAYRVGLALSGSGLLLLPAWLGWHATFLVAAGLTALFAVALALTPPIALPPPARAPGRCTRCARGWRVRAWLPVIAFVILFRIGDQAMGPMLPTFWVDRGFSDAELALFANLLGAGATIAGAIAGGAWSGARRDRVRALGDRRARARLEPRVRRGRGVARDRTHRCVRRVAARGGDAAARSARRSSPT